MFWVKRHSFLSNVYQPLTESPASIPFSFTDPASERCSTGPKLLKFIRYFSVGDKNEAFERVPKTHQWLPDSGRPQILSYRDQYCKTSLLWPTWLHFSVICVCLGSTLKGGMPLYGWHTACLVWIKPNRKICCYLFVVMLLESYWTVVLLLWWVFASYYLLLENQHTDQIENFGFNWWSIPKLKQKSLTVSIYRTCYKKK